MAEVKSIEQVWWVKELLAVMNDPMMSNDVRKAIHVALKHLNVREIMEQEHAAAAFENEVPSAPASAGAGEERGVR